MPALQEGFVKDFLTANPVLKKRFSSRARGQRMEKFLRTMNIKGGERILDLGGTVAFWDGCPHPLDLTIVNLPGAAEGVPERSSHRITLVEGDACALDLPGDPRFDIVVSNSVIEHVGDRGKRAQLAREVRRHAARYWVQTPSIWFPVEAHTNMPLWWAYPAPLKAAFLRRWRRRLPAWAEMIDGTTVVSRRELETLFPDARIWVERYMGFSKSYVAYKTG